ncbi:DUF4359 domain-containing protein [Synechococcus sp. CB0101]|uniref:DUF4359 domain-containing protein n=1 Tax=Synechococcus sp. CB0101 TaxID=232348 RepID=UPI00020021BB|nr:DUF4359 domain-containing protein [Synechococcus sp. CB0101]
MSGPWGWCLAAALLGGALVATNPDEQDFEDFAGERLVLLADAELCDQGGLPMVARLLIQNCSELVQGQRAVLGRLALQGSRRINAGVFSLYNTEIGGQTLLPGLRLPRYRILTLGVAGQLVMLQASADEA